MKVSQHCITSPMAIPRNFWFKVKVCVQSVLNGRNQHSELSKRSHKLHLQCECGVYQSDCLWQLLLLIPIPMNKQRQLTYSCLHSCLCCRLYTTQINVPGGSLYIDRQIIICPTGTIGITVVVIQLLSCSINIDNHRTSHPTQNIDHIFTMNFTNLQPQTVGSLVGESPASNAYRSRHTLRRDLSRSSMEPDLLRNIYKGAHQVPNTVHLGL